jgi:hypothetical protein
VQDPPYPSHIAGGVSVAIPSGICPVEAHHGIF